MKKFISVLGITFLGLSLAACSTTEEQTPNQKVKIGISIPLTGDAASYGLGFQRGSQMALEEMDPELKDKFEIVFEDDQLEATKAIANFNHLNEMEGMNVFVTLSSTIANALAPLAESKQIPMIAWASDPQSVAGREWVVKFGAIPEVMNEVLVEEARKRGVKKVVEVATVQDYMLLSRDLFNEAQEGEIEVVLSEDFVASENDFRSFIARMKDQDFDSIFANLMPGQLGLFARKVREGGMDQQIFSFETIGDPNEVEIAQGALLGAWFVQGDDSNKDFENRFNEEYLGESFLAVPEGHDITLLLADAISKYGADKEQINDYLHNVQDFSGAMGVFSASERNDFLLPAIIKIVTKDGFEQLYK